MRQGFDGHKEEEAARRICQELDFPFYPIDLSREFANDVVDYFVSEYACGRTPNPCVRCNKLIKFGAFLRIARELGASSLATGHYARITGDERSGYRLWKGKDKNKDQSYFLYELDQAKLANILFPLADSDKADVLELVKQKKIPVCPVESQDICFLASSGQAVDHNDFLRERLQLVPGPIIEIQPETDKEGQRLTRQVGEHCGLPLYTLGQRRGIEIGGIGPFYAARKDQERNILYVVARHHDPVLMSGAALVSQVNWVSGRAPSLPLDCQAVIRYRHKPVVVRVSGKTDSNQYRLDFFEPQRAVTPGQSAVFYQSGEVLGGGIIAGD
jgi:tRNA-specific 2-thiouridylase